MVRNPSLRSRFAVAVALTVGFYLLALALMAALLAVPVLMLEAGRGNLWLAVACLAGGGSIADAIRPRRQPFAAPGPALTAEAQPRLHGFLDEASGQAGEPGPDEVYATLEVNAAVLERRTGILRRGRRRVLILGLPLLALVDREELRTIVAHELGHYSGGDTRVGPWTWRTRAAIERTLRALNPDEGLSKRIIRGPFLLYAKAFFRITNGISRQQEFAADRLSARVAGPAAAASALRTVHAADPAWAGYLDGELAPAVDGGFLPPVLAGFATYRSQAPVREASERFLEEQLSAASDPYASHPTLGERLAALGDPGERAPGTPALGLLDDAEAVMGAVIDHHLPRDAAPLEPVAWEALPATLWIPSWRRAAAAVGAEAAAGRSIAQLPDAVAQTATDPERDARRRVLAMCLGAALADRGWTAEADPGVPVTLHREGHTIEPFALVEDLAAGRIDADGWARIREDAEIADGPLAPAAQAEPVAA